jgi:signal transduction histidine kinase
VSVIVVQAAAGDDVFEHNPAAAREALRSIESAGRQALAELRRLLAAIGPPEPAEGRRPQPELTRLEDLAEPLRAVGLIVEIKQMDDMSQQVPPGVQLSAYRIVQEALTNVVRHARAHRIEVRVQGDEEYLELIVTDDGTPGAFVPGRGIAGMRERAALLGGTLEAGPEPNGGFRVRARLPVTPIR